MADELRTFPVVCNGGLIKNRDPLTQASQLSGSAIRLINYEPALQGGYRKINGYLNDYGTLPGTGKVLGVAVNGNINDGIFACRKPSAGNNYLYYWNDTTDAWVAVTVSGSPTMVGVDLVRFTSYNWTQEVFVLTDGVNPAAKYDGTTYTQITATNAPAAPKYAAAFANHLFLAGDATEPYNLFFSAPLDETDFSPANGAGVINVGFTIVQIKAFRDQLYIFGQREIKRLVGTDIGNFVVQQVTSDLGCLASESVMEFGGDILFLGPDGIRPVSGTSKIGDVELETVSREIQDIFELYTRNEDLSKIRTVVLRKKSQFRLFFESAEALSILGGIRQSAAAQSTFEYSQLTGIGVTCVDSGYIGQFEYVIHGDTTGKVYRQERGYTFDGDEIFSLYQTPYFYMDDPEVRKIYYSLKTYLLSEGETTVAVGINFNYGDSEVAVPSNYSVSTTGAAAFYGIATYDTTDIYDGNPSPVRKTNIAGSGDSISVSFVTNNTTPSHTIQAITVTYGLADRR